MARPYAHQRLTISDWTYMVRAVMITKPEPDFLPNASSNASFMACRRVTSYKIKTTEYFFFREKKVPASNQYFQLSEWRMTVPQLSIIIIYNSTWSTLIQQIRIKLSGDNLTQKTQRKDPFTSLHKIKANLPFWEEFEIFRNGTLSLGHLDKVHQPTY